MSLHQINLARHRTFAHRIPPQRHHTIIEYVEGQLRRALAQTSRLVVSSDATLTYVLVGLGACSIEKSLTVELAGEGSQADIRGIIVGSGTQSFTLKSLTLHRVPRTRARITIDAVLTDSAAMDYDGMIKIVKAGQQTDSYLASHALLLSEDCRANAIPALEIEANDVKCSHEVTVAPLDEDHLFYLMSRGLPWDHAAQMIIDGFISPTLAKIPDVGLRRRFEKEVSGKICLLRKR